MLVKSLSKNKRCDLKNDNHKKYNFKYIAYRRTKMNSIGSITIYGLIFGMCGTTLGGLIGAFLKVDSNKILSFVLEFAAGLMTAIICFDLIPEAIEFSNITGCIIGIMIGILVMILCDELINKINFSRSKIENNTLFKTGMIICIGLTVHNFPERISDRVRIWCFNNIRIISCDSNCDT